MLAVKQNTTLKEQNLSAILKRLSKLREAENVEKIIPGDEQGLFLRKQENTLEMYCFDNETNKLSDIMCRIDLTNPLNLIGTYTQAAFLSAFWQTEEPENIYLAGFGGGRLAMLYDHYFPFSKVYGSDYDPNVLSVASDYFGISDKILENVTDDDSRADLTKSDILHDIIFLDVFAGGGEHVNHLATVEFFELCKSKLSQHGVVAANLVIFDARMHQKIKAMQKVFNHCLLWEHNGSHVIFASNNQLDLEAFIERVADFQLIEKLDFELVDKAKMLRSVSLDEPIQPLRDADL